jgi:hypothetical protein
MKAQALVWVLQSTARRHPSTRVSHRLAMGIGWAIQVITGLGMGWNAPLGFQGLFHLAIPC